MTGPSLVINARRFAQDTRAVHWSNNDWYALLDEAAKLLQSELKVLKNRTSLSIVANQRTYAMAKSVLVPQEIELYQAGGTYKIRGRTMEEIRNQRLPLYGSRPFFYSYVDDEQTLFLTPTPDTSADTDQLNGAVNSTVTTLTLDSTDDFYNEGRVIIDSEVIGYTAKTSTTLTGCVRGMEGTTAASHSDNAVVTERDLFIYGIRRYLDREMFTYYTTGTVAITNGLTALVGTSTVWSTAVQAGDYFGITANATSIDPVKWYKIQTVTDNTNIVLADAFTEVTQTAGTYIIGSANPFPSQYDGFFKAYLLAQALDKEGDTKGSLAQWSKVERFLKTAAAGTHKPDTLLHPRGRHDHGRRPWGRMGVSGGSTYDTF